MLRSKHLVTSLMAVRPQTINCPKDLSLTAIVFHHSKQDCHRISLCYELPQLQSGVKVDCESHAGSAQLSVLTSANLIELISKAETYPRFYSNLWCGTRKLLCSTASLLQSHSPLYKGWLWNVIPPTLGASSTSIRCKMRAPVPSRRQKTIKRQLHAASGVF